MHDVKRGNCKSCHRVNVDLNSGYRCVVCVTRYNWCLKKDNDRLHVELERYRTMEAVNEYARGRR